MQQQQSREDGSHINKNKIKILNKTKTQKELTHPKHKSKAAAAACCCCRLLLLQVAAAAACCCCTLLLLQQLAAAGAVQML